MIDAWFKYGEHGLYDNHTKKFEDTNCVIRSRKVKDRQYNDQKKKKTIKKNKLQNTTKITKDCATLYPVKSGG